MWTVLIAGMTGIAAGSATGLPFFELGSFDLPVIGLTIQWFGILAATGVLTGAYLGRKYGDRHGIDDDDLRGMTAWVVVSGFVGAHVFDVLAYQTDDLLKDPWLLFKLWKGISSYGGFIGGALGFAWFVWWKRLKPGVWADLTTVGLLSGFTVGRVGCTVVHDHMGRPTDHFLGVDYPVDEVIARVCTWEGRVRDCPAWVETLGGPIERMHNLGMYELMYLLPVNALIMWLAFRKKQSPAGLLAVVTGVLYAPVRFFFEFLRFNETDPRYVGLTFAQWASIAAFGTALWFAYRILKHGKPAPRASELGDQVGGRRHSGPSLTKKQLDEVEREARADKAARGSGGGTKGKGDKK